MAYLKRYYDPPLSDYPSLLARPMDRGGVNKVEVRRIIEAVRSSGDRALLSLTQAYDGVALNRIRVSAEEIRAASDSVSDELKEALRVAYTNIEAFHRAQVGEGERLVVSEGIELRRRIVPIQRVGLYIPGGSAPLISTVLMLAIPAQVAGCPSIALCTPPGGDGTVDPAILWAAELCGVNEIYAVGGAQAIAALAWGTESIHSVDKIFGPGNSWVTEAKVQVGAQVCAIDLPAGPSEVMVIASPASNAAFVASDLLSQAEHGSDSQAMLIVLAEREEGDSFLDRVEREIEHQMRILDRSGQLEASLAHSRAFIAPSEEGALALANAYAAEHLIINLDDAKAEDRLLEKIKNAGSIFLGPYSPESSGDYASGTNHTLPTAGWARSYSGVSTDSFIKKITVQRLSKEGLTALAPTLTVLAEAEGLRGHGRAVSIRMEEQ
jgi:histidinol dehydrogenase